ncbi:uncharacterized protein LOC143206527 [Rhynchophorus ferrugineus]|uniref:uncharacterized protein LOC143206527 n=1 Tax=Rhynchophorus ferrugineus TaxID=354439 RepID=UPI003FCCE768
MEIPFNNIPDKRLEVASYSLSGSSRRYWHPARVQHLGLYFWVFCRPLFHDVKFDMPQGCYNTPLPGFYIQLLQATKMYEKISNTKKIYTKQNVLHEKGFEKYDKSKRLWLVRLRSGTAVDIFRSYRYRCFIVALALECGPSTTLKTSYFSDRAPVIDAEGGAFVRRRGSLFSSMTRRWQFWYLGEDMTCLR